MAKSYSVKIDLVIVDDFGNPFFDSHDAWHGVNYAGVVGMEHLLNDIHTQLLNLGKSMVPPDQVAGFNTMVGKK